MAQLFSCKDCGKDISLSAKLCPHCGRSVELTDIPFDKMTLNQKVKICLMSFFGLMLVFFFISIFLGDHKETEIDVSMQLETSQKQIEIVLYFQSSSESQVLDAVWFSENSLKLGVQDDGSNRTGFAMYACTVLKEKDYPVNDVIVRIIDIKELTTIQKWVTLGMAECAKY